MRKAKNVQVIWKCTECPFYSTKKLECKESEEFVSPAYSDPPPVTCPLRTEDIYVRVLMPKSMKELKEV